MPLSIGTRQLKDDLWEAHAVCSGADMEYFFAKTQDEAYAMAKHYLNENYFKLSNEEINKRVLLRKVNKNEIK